MLCLLRSKPVMVKLHAPPPFGVKVFDQRPPLMEVGSIKLGHENGEISLEKMGGE